MVIRIGEKPKEKGGEKMQGLGSIEKPKQGSIVCKKYFEQIAEIKVQITRLEDKVFDLLPSPSTKGEVSPKVQPMPSDFVQVAESLDSIIGRLINLAETIDKEL